LKPSKTIVTRIVLLIKAVGIVFVALGLAVGYAASTTPLVPPLLAVFYLVAVIFLLSGLYALVARIE